MLHAFYYYKSVSNKKCFIPVPSCLALHGTVGHPQSINTIFKQAAAKYSKNNYKLTVCGLSHVSSQSMVILFVFILIENKIHFKIVILPDLPYGFEKVVPLPYIDT